MQLIIMYINHSCDIVSVGPIAVHLPGALAKLKKSKNLRKTRKWMGGSSPNPNLFVHASKKCMGVGGWVSSG